MNILAVIYHYEYLQTLSSTDLAKEVPRVGTTGSLTYSSYFRWKERSWILYGQTHHQIDQQRFRGHQL
jgi:hypothetical protein